MRRNLVLAGAALTAFAFTFATADEAAKCDASKDAKKGECPHMAKQKSDACCSGHAVKATSDKCQGKDASACPAMHVEANEAKGAKVEAKVEAPAAGAAGVKVFLGPDGKPTAPTQDQLKSLPQIDESKAYGPETVGDPNDPRKGFKVEMQAPTTYMIAVKQPDGSVKMECKEGTDPNALVKQLEAESKPAEAPKKAETGDEK